MKTNKYLIAAEAHETEANKIFEQRVKLKDEGKSVAHLGPLWSFHKEEARALRLKAKGETNE